MTEAASAVAPSSPAVERRQAEILEAAAAAGVKFIRLQFTDILGVIKNVEVPERQFADALDGRVMFDGSSIEGFVRIEESDMYLRPDLDTFRVYPWPTHQAGGLVQGWRGPHIKNGIHRGHKGKRWHQNFIPGSNVEGHKR